jgi:hypothetical protein
MNKILTTRSQLRYTLESGRRVIFEPLIVCVVAWDPATAVRTTLTVNNTVATNTGIWDAGFTSQGVTSDHPQSTGKYYFEITYNAASSSSFTGLGIGVGPQGGTVDDFNSNEAPDGVVLYGGPSWQVFANAHYDSSASLVSLGGTNGAGDTIGCAVDLVNHKVWFMVVAGPDYYPAGGWNSNGGSWNPATNLGGTTITSGSKLIFGTFNDGDATETLKINTNGPFLGVVPAGFIGWPC